jgi:hypothetical protein
MPASSAAGWNNNTIFAMPFQRSQDGCRGFTFAQVRKKLKKTEGKQRKIKGKTREKKEK